MPKIDPDEQLDPRSQEAPVAFRRTGDRPWRIIPLAVIAIFGTTAATGLTMEMFRNVSDDRYAHEILRDKLAGSAIAKQLGPR